MTSHYTVTDTPPGPLTLCADGDGTLVAAGFVAGLDALAAAIATPLQAEPAPDLGPVSRAVQAYFAGDLDALDALPVAQPGGPFAQQAWQAMRAVPAGRTTSYAALAAAAGRPAAVRAAGAACAGNDVSLVVPCHRVVRTDGSLGGYLWGLTVKRWLLAHEQG